MIKFIKNRDLIWDVEKYDVILVGCSIYNLLTQVFQAKLCVKYPGLKTVDGKTPYADKRKYGTRVSYDVNGQTISLMYICGYPYKNKEYINYDGEYHYDDVNYKTQLSLCMRELLRQKANKEHNLF